ncbi:hypothetical protein J4457_06340 [Candidatus Woesearchaeota archaeon]|nr:hypothetical protein [Candidatus Woesearchaeota archaeon]
MSRKASLELSVNAIVIIVLAMTLLGLGLGFIRSQFGEITEIGTGVQEQIKQQILEDLRTGNKKLSFPTSEVQMGRRDDTVIAMGIKNVESKSINFGIEIKPVGNPEVTDVNFRYQNESGDPNRPYPFSLGAAEADVYPVRINTGTGTGTNTYSITVRFATPSSGSPPTCPPGYPSPVGQWCLEDSTYAQKTFFLTVQ